MVGQDVIHVWGIRELIAIPFYIGTQDGRLSYVLMEQFIIDMKHIYQVGLWERIQITKYGKLVLNAKVVEQLVAPTAMERVR